MGKPSNTSIPLRKLPHALYLGYGMLLATSPTTSATEVSFASSLLKEDSLGWYDQIVFVVCFIIAIALLNKFSRHYSSMFSLKALLPVSFIMIEVGVSVYALAVFGTIGMNRTLVGSGLRGIGFAGLTLGWLEVFVDISPRLRFTSIALPLSLLVAAVMGIVIWLSIVFVNPIVSFIMIIILPAASIILLYRSRKKIIEREVPHLHSTHKLDMPRTTKWIIFVFGLALGCTWAVFYSEQRVNLPFWACLAFLTLSIFMVIGIRTFMPAKELEFGFALRWSMLLTFCGFLLLPVLIFTVPGMVAFLLALAWAAQILLLALMPMQIASKLPVNMISVASEGGVPFGFGAAMGSLVAGAVLSSLGPGPYSYSIVTAVVCLSFAVAVLYFPSKNADASVIGMGSVPENELHAQRIERRSKEVAEKWGLTHREREVMLLMALGKSRSQIAENFNISNETVKTHGKHIYEKLDVHSIRELVTLIESGRL